MARTRLSPWIGLGFDAWRLGLEASAVIGMRSARIAFGDAGAQAEAELMVREKVNAALDLQKLALTGGLGGSPASATARVLSHYRRKVRANKRRLEKR